MEFFFAEIVSSIFLDFFLRSCFLDYLISRFGILPKLLRVNLPKDSIGIVSEIVSVILEFLQNIYFRIPLEIQPKTISLRNKFPKKTELSGGTPDQICGGIAEESPVLEISY